MSEQVEPWIVTHVRERRGHVTEMTMFDPGSCRNCDQRAPAHDATTPPPNLSTTEGES